jgi:hypothetical protein
VPGAADSALDLGASGGEYEDDMIGCDYNGWTDLPEEEREALDAYSEGSKPRPAARRYPFSSRLTPRLRRRAA